VGDLGGKRQAELETLWAGAVKVATERTAERDEARQQLANLRAAVEREIASDRHSVFVTKGDLIRLLADPACGGPEHGDAE